MAESAAPRQESDGGRQQRGIRILGVPMDLGQQRRGVDMGPSAVRYAGLQDRLAALGYSVRDSGNIEQDADGVGGQVKWLSFR